MSEARGALPWSDVGEGFRRAMRAVASTVFVVAARHGDVRMGLTVTSVTSLSLEPPSVLVCINRASRTHAVLTSAARFGVSVLDHRHAAIADAFAGRHGAHERSALFEAGPGTWGEGPHAAPLLREAAAAFVCETRERIEFATHTILIGEVLAVEEGLNDGAPPLLYSRGGYRRLEP